MAPVTQLTITVKNQTEYSLQADSNPKSCAVVNGTQCLAPPVDATAESIVTGGVYISNGVEGDGVQGVAAYLAPMNTFCLAIWFRVLSDQSSPNVSKVAAFNPMKSIDLALVQNLQNHDFASPAKFPFTDPETGEEVILLARAKITPGGISTATITLTIQP